MQGLSSENVDLDWLTYVFLWLASPLLYYMPFTFAHTALIIPLCYIRRRYRWISATGLITGSVAPDFEKFFRLKLTAIVIR
jgi:hypothetical protein